MSKYDFNNETPFSIFVTNLGKYNEGELVGEWVSMPTTPEEYGAVLDRIGIDEEYEEVFITDYDNYTDLPINNLGEYPNIGELNMLAEKLEDMDESQYETLCAAVEMREVDSLPEILNIALNVEEGNFVLRDDIKSEEDLGRSVIEEYGGCYLKDTPGLSAYIDYEEFGESIINELDELDEDIDARELGEQYAEDVPISALADFIDYEALGKDEAAYKDAEITDKGMIECLEEEDLYNDTDNDFDDPIE